MVEDVNLHKAEEEILKHVRFHNIAY
jgi:hypothetical protein